MRNRRRVSEIWDKSRNLQDIMEIEAVCDWFEGTLSIHWTISITEMVMAMKSVSVSRKLYKIANVAT